MGISVFPAASAGLTVNDLVTQPKWTLLSTYRDSSETPIDNSFLDFTNLNQNYRALKIEIRDLRRINAGRVRISLNNDTTAGNYRYRSEFYEPTSEQFPISSTSESNFRLNSIYNTSATSPVESTIILPNYTNATGPKEFYAKTFWSTGTEVFSIVYGDYVTSNNNAGPITSFQLRSDGSMTFKNNFFSGLYIYGAN